MGAPRMTAERPNIVEIQHNTDALLDGFIPPSSFYCKQAARYAADLAEYALSLEAELLVVRERAERLEQELERYRGADLEWLRADFEARLRAVLDESRLEEIEQRVRDASERGGRNWYKTDVPELLRAVRVERERAERLERELKEESEAKWTARKATQEAENEKAELEARLGRATEALHQWMGAFSAGYFDNLARERRLTVLEIAKASDAVLAEQEKQQP